MNAKRWIALVIALGIFGVSVIASVTVGVLKNIGDTGSDFASLTDDTEEVTLDKGSPAVKSPCLKWTARLRITAGPLACSAQAGMITDHF